MRVLVTGGAGTLGNALGPALITAGYEPRLMDVAPLQTALDFVRGDVTRAADVARAMDGVDYVVHTAAWHGIHLRDHAPHEFMDLNVGGTFNLWRAAAEAGVRGVVFSSTMGVYGESANPGDDGRAVRVDEDLPLRPADIYGFSKVVGEEMCRWMGRERGIPSIALRYGMFVPEPFFRYGIRLLYGGVDTDDVVAAVMAALSAMSDGKLGWDSFNVQSPLPFGEDDGLELRRDPLTVLDRYYPGARSLLTQRGVDRLGPIDRYFPVDRLVTRLGLRPSHSFGAWLDELRRRPNERATANPPWP